MLDISLRHSLSPSHLSVTPLVKPQTPGLSSRSIQVGEEVITEADILPRITRYQLLPQFLREVILDQAIVPFTHTDEELQIAAGQFYEYQQIQSDRDLEIWLKRNYMTQSQLEEVLSRAIRVVGE